MNSKQIQNIYTANGLSTYEVTCHGDLMKVHGVNVEQIEGYNKMTEKNRSVFDAFIQRFYNVQGLERRAELLPQSINFVISEQSLGKVNAADDYFIPLGTTITAIYVDGNETKMLKKWKAKNTKIFLVHR